jgi:hypothetical protein
MRRAKAFSNTLAAFSSVTSHDKKQITWLPLASKEPGKASILAGHVALLNIL